MSKKQARKRKLLIQARSSIGRDNMNYYLLTHLYNLAQFFSYGFIYSKEFGAKHLKYFTVKANDSILLSHAPRGDLVSLENCIIVLPDFKDPKRFYKSQATKHLEADLNLDLAGIYIPICMIEKIIFPDAETFDKYSQMEFSNTLEYNEVPTEIVSGLAHTDQPVYSSSKIENIGPLFNQANNSPPVDNSQQRKLSKPIFNTKLINIEAKYLKHLWKLNLLSRNNLISQNYISNLPKTYKPFASLEAKVDDQVGKIIEYAEVLPIPESYGDPTRSLYHICVDYFSNFVNRIKESHLDVDTYDNIRDRSFHEKDLRAIIDTYLEIVERDPSYDSQKDDRLKGLNRILDYYQEIDLRYNTIIEGITKKYEDPIEKEILTLLVHLIKYNDQPSNLYKLYKGCFQEEVISSKTLISLPVMLILGIQQLPASFKYDINWRFGMSSFRDKSLITSRKLRKSQLPTSLPVIQDVFKAPDDQDSILKINGIKYFLLNELTTVERDPKNNRQLIVSCLLENEFGVSHRYTSSLSYDFDGSRAGVLKLLEHIDERDLQNVVRSLKKYLGSVEPMELLRLIKKSYLF